MPRPSERMLPKKAVSPLQSQGASPLEGSYVNVAQALSEGGGDFGMHTYQFLASPRRRGARSEPCWSRLGKLGIRSSADHSVAGERTPGSRGHPISEKRKEDGKKKSILVYIFIFSERHRDMVKFSEKHPVPTQLSSTANTREVFRRPDEPRWHGQVISRIPRKCPINAR